MIEPCNLPKQDMTKRRCPGDQRGRDPAQEVGYGTVCLNRIRDPADATNHFGIDLGS